MPKAVLMKVKNLTFWALMYEKDSVEVGKDLVTEKKNSKLDGKHFLKRDVYFRISLRIP